MNAVEVLSTRIQSSWSCELRHWNWIGHVLDKFRCVCGYVVVVLTTHQRRELLELTHFEGVVVGIPSVVKPEDTDAGVLGACLQRHFSGEDSHIAVHNSQIFD